MGCIIYPALISTDKKEKKRNVLVRQLSDTFEVCETLLSARSLVHIKLGLTQNGQHKQIHKQVLERMQRKGNPSALLVGMQTGAATVENSMEFPQKTENGTVF